MGLVIGQCRNDILVTRLLLKKSQVRKRNMSLFLYKLQNYRAWLKNLNKINNIMTRKMRNERKHSEEGNKDKSLNLAWWNNKLAANERGIKSRDNLAALVNREQPDILSISEANIYRNDPPGSAVIKGFNMVPDNLLNEYGRSRSIIHVKYNLRYKLRCDIMDNDMPEVWLELS